jgi:hypothetical protein
MKTIKEKSLIFQPKSADVAHRIPQGIRLAADLGLSQVDRSGQDREESKPEDQVADSVQQSAFHATDLLASKFKSDQAKSRNPFQTNRIRSNRVSFSRKPGVSTIRPKQNALHPHAKSAQIKSAHFLKSQKFASISMAKMTRSVSQKIVISIKTSVAGLRSIGTVIAAGGWVAVALVVVLAFIGWIMTTPASIFAGGKYEDDPSRSVYTVLDELAQEVDDKINEIIEEHGNGCDISIQYEDGNENILEQVGPLILAVYAVKVGTDPSEPDQVATLDARKEAVLRDIFWQAVLIDFDIQERPVIDSIGVETTTSHLKINIKLLSPDQLIGVMRLNNELRDVVFRISELLYELEG